MRKLTILASIAALAASLTLGAPSSALAVATDAGCILLSGDQPGGPGTECQISSTVPFTGPVAVGVTLHILNGGHIDASTGGITLTITGDLVIDGGGQIEANDVSGNLISAGNVTITTSGNVIMQAGSKITALNQFDGGSGGVITIDVNGSKMVMCGPSGSTDAACGGAHALAGAVIDVSNNSGNTAPAGKVFITVGAAPVGQFLMGGSANVGGTDFAGALVQANSSHGLAGEIDIKAGEKIVEEPGAKVLSIAGSGDSSHGGPISLISGCQVLISGEVSSIGPDPGADLVHVEGCELHVTSTGLIQSTAPAHTGASGKCADNGHASDAGVCVEIWARHVIIDAGGEINANFALSGGTTGSGWIDIYAQEDIVINGPPVGTTFLSCGATVPKFAVHSNSCLGSDAVTGVVTVKAKNSTISMTGQALQASATANGSNGGSITVEASQWVNLDTATLVAAGDNVGGGTQCDSGSGACGNGGKIAVRSWNDAITWQSGVGNVNPDEGAAPPAGSISLTACTTVTTTGTAFDDAAPTVNTGGAFCGVGPVIPAYVVFNPDGSWDTCGQSSISGHKFDSGHNNAPLQGWTIHITGPGVDTTAVTDINGLYTFNVPGGQIYKICEVLKDATWTQTSPVAGPGVVACSGPGEAPLGYQVTLNVEGACCGGAQVTGKDFGNNQAARPPECKEDPNRAPLLTRTVDLSKPNLSGGGVAGNPKNYWLVQAAYNDAKVSAQAEVIGLLANTNENLLLDGYKSLTITQCTVARVTGAAGSPVWNITNTKKLTIISPDSVGGTVGWRVQTNGHDLKSIRATGASMYGIQIIGNSNSVSTNSVSGSPEGIRVEGDSNTIKSGTISGNGIGVHFTSTANGNTLSGSTIRNNTSHGIFVEGSGNTISDDKVYSNAGDGVRTAATATSTTLKSVGSGSSGENGGAEFRLGATAINGGGNKADGVSVPSAAKGCATFNAGSVCE